MRQGHILQLGSCGLGAQHRAFDAISLSKLTVAPFSSFGKIGFFERPQLRAFVTWVDWSEPGAITQQAALGNATDGMTLGVQYENLW